MITEFKNEECFSHILKVEDHFMFADTFQAGFGSTPRKSSMCAYGTVLDYANFDKAWEKIKDKYSPDCWKEMCEYWLFQHYLSPIPVLFVSCIYRKLGLELDIKEATERATANAHF
jgi:hypothetical protein